MPIELWVFDHFCRMVRPWSTCLIADLLCRKGWAHRQNAAESLLFLASLYGIRPGHVLTVLVCKRWQKNKSRLFWRRAPLGRSWGVGKEKP